MIIVIQTLRLARLILSASAAMASALPHIYSKSQQIQVHVKIQSSTRNRKTKICSQASVNQAAFCLAASSLSESKIIHFVKFSKKLIDLICYNCWHSGIPTGLYQQYLHITSSQVSPQTFQLVWP